MSEYTNIIQSDDEMIVRGPSTSLATYWRIGQKTTVSRRNSGTWLCLTCQGQDRWADKERKGCAHLERVRRFVDEHPDEDAA